MMLEAEVGDVIAQSVEEVIVAIVMRAEKLLRLLDETLVMVPDILRCVESGGAVGGDIHFSEGVLRQWNHLQEFSGNDGGIYQRGERDRSELDFVSGLAANGERCSKLPSL